MAKEEIVTKKNQNRGQYVDGYVIPVPKNKVDEYRKLASKAGKIWIEYGALEYRECIGDDLKIKGLVSFIEAAKAKSSETVIFSWIIFKSKKQRNEINAKVMTDPRISNTNMASCPFDFRKMIFGGFKVIVKH
ncbi:MAG: DUF1428 domain-containing protein [bacterium]